MTKGNQRRGDVSCDVREGFGGAGWVETRRGEEGEGALEAEGGDVWVEGEEALEVEGGEVWVEGEGALVAEGGRYGRI